MLVPRVLGSPLIFVKKGSRKHNQCALEEDCILLVLDEYISCNMRKMKPGHQFLQSLVIVWTYTALESFMGKKKNFSNLILAEIIDKH